MVKLMINLDKWHFKNFSIKNYVNKQDYENALLLDSVCDGVKQ